MVSIFILHSSHDFYISACLDETLIDTHLLHTVINNSTFKPKTLHKIKLDVLFSSNIIIRNDTNKFFQRNTNTQYPPYVTGGNAMSFHTSIETNNNNNTNLSSPSSAPGSSSTYQNTSSSSYQQSRQQPLQQQQHTSNSSGDDSEEAMIGHIFKKTSHPHPHPHPHQQPNSLPLSAVSSSNFSKSNVKLHNSNSLMQQINPDHHHHHHNHQQYMQSNRAHSFNTYHHLNSNNKYNHHSQNMNTNDNFYNQQNNSNLNRTTTTSSIYNQVYPTDQFDSNQYSLYNQQQQQQHHNSQNYRRFNGVNAYLNSLPLSERMGADVGGSSDVEMHHKNNEKNSQNNIRNSYESSSSSYEQQHTKRKLFSEVGLSASTAAAAAAQQHSSSEHAPEINSSISSMSSSNNNNNNNNNNSSSNSLENRVLESYLNTIKKVGESAGNGDGGTTILYKNYSHSDECNQSDYGERYSDTGSTFNKSV
jgi:hypothetical protein